MIPAHAFCAERKAGESPSEAGTRIAIDWPPGRFDTCGSGKLLAPWLRMQLQMHY